MSKPNYRVIVTFDGERKVFNAHAPELEHCTAEGATRAEAIARAEEEIDAQLANMLSHGSTPPRAVDEEVFSGELAAHVSKGLHRDLSYQARAEGIELDQLVGEILAAGVEARKHTQRVQRSGNRVTPESVPHDNIGNRHDGGGGQRRGNFGGGRGGYGAQLLDDRANFIEYVRGLENGGFQQRPGGGGGGPGGGGGGGGGGDRGGAGDRGRRRRGRGGSGGGGNGPRPPMHGGPQQQHQNRNGNGGQPQQGGQQAMAAPAPNPPGPPPGNGGNPPGSNGNGSHHDDGGDDGNA